jgi:hypothetical protein
MGWQVVLRWRLVGHSDGVFRDCRAGGFLRHSSLGRASDDLAPILGAVGLTLVTLSHLIPIAMGYELVPAYLAADPRQSSLSGLTS